MRMRVKSRDRMPAAQFSDDASAVFLLRFNTAELEDEYDSANR